VGGFLVVAAAGAEVVGFGIVVGMGVVVGIRVVETISVAEMGVMVGYSGGASTETKAIASALVGRGS
jgi:hypothetical protein